MWLFRDAMARRWRRIFGWGVSRTWGVRSKAWVCVSFGGGGREVGDGMRRDGETNVERLGGGSF